MKLPIYWMICLVWIQRLPCIRKHYAPFPGSDIISTPFDRNAITELYFHMCSMPLFALRVPSVNSCRNRAIKWCFHRPSRELFPADEERRHNIRVFICSYYILSHVLVTRDGVRIVKSIINNPQGVNHN